MMNNHQVDVERPELKGFITSQDHDRTIIDLSAARNARILLVAACIIATRGLAGLDLETVAERCGIAFVTVRQAFPNKESMVTELLNLCREARRTLHKAREETGGRRRRRG